MISQSFDAKRCGNAEPHGQHMWVEVGNGEGYVCPENDRHSYVCFGRQG